MVLISNVFPLKDVIKSWQAGLIINLGLFVGSL